MNFRSLIPASFRPTVLFITLSLSAFGATGCISNGEYQALVDASHKYVDVVADDYIARLKADPHINPQTVANRQLETDTYRAALKAADDRLSGNQNSATPGVSK